MNLNNYALVMLKPDAMDQMLDNVIFEGLEANGLMVIKRKIVTLTQKQAEDLYAEKRGINYFPRLTEYVSSGQCMCLVVKATDGENATRQAKEYRDWARQHLKLTKFDLTEDDVSLLNEGSHPQQAEITREMALQNLVHVSDDFGSDCEILAEMLTSWELEEMRDREPELHSHITSLKDRGMEHKTELLSSYARSAERL